jgi:hypothetical protein
LPVLRADQMPLNRCSDAQMLRCSDAQMLRCSDAQMLRCSEQVTAWSRLGGTVEGPLAMAPLPGPKVSWEGPCRGQWRDRLPWHRSQGLESPGRDHGGVLLVCGCVVLGVHAHRRFHVFTELVGWAPPRRPFRHSVERGPIPTFRPAPPHDRVCAYVRGHIVDGPV